RLTPVAFSLLKHNPKILASLFISQGGHRFNGYVGLEDADRRFFPNRLEIFAGPRICDVTLPKDPYTVGGRFPIPFHDLLIATTVNDKGTVGPEAYPPVWIIAE